MESPESEPQPVAPRRAPSGVALLALALLVAALGQASVFSMRWDCFDFYQFWVVGQAAHEQGTGNVWAPDERLRLGQTWARKAAVEQAALGGNAPRTRRTVAASRRQDLETYSTPWLYTLFGWTASGDYGTDLDRFQVVGLLAFAGALLGLARFTGMSWSAGALLVAFLLTFFGPTLSDMRVGNVNRLQLAALCGVVLLGARRGAGELAGGFLLGLAVMFKPNLAFPALALGVGWIVLGRWGRLVRQVPAALVGAAAAFGLSSWWFGRAAAWNDWRAVLGELMEQYESPISKGNLALVRLLEEAGLGGAGAVVALGLGAGLVAALVVRRRAQAGAAPLEDLALVGLGGALSVSTAKLAWVHYYLLVVPLAVYLVRPAAPTWARVGGVLGLVLVAGEPLKDLFRYSDAGALNATLVALGVLALYVTTLIELARPDGARAAT